MVTKFFISFLLFIIPLSEMYADGGCCIKYKVRITLQNDSIIDGYYYSPCLDMELDSQSINWIIENEFSPSYFDFKDSIEIYRETINLFSSPSYGEKIITAFKKDRYRISFKDIKSVTQIDKIGCHDSSTGRWKFQSNGLFPFVITEFTDDEISRMINATPDMFIYFDKCDCWGLSYLWIISYNKSFTSEELITLLEKRICIKDKWNINQLDYNECQKQYLILKEELKKQSIIIFRTDYLN